jgi:hypothetical protein
MPPANARKPPKYALIKRIALSLPGTREVLDRHGHWFNIGKKTFALCSYGGDKWILRLPHPQIHMLVEAEPETFTPMRNATMLWIYVDVSRLDAGALRGYVTAAWRYTAPKKIVKAFDEA